MTNAILKAGTGIAKLAAKQAVNIGKEFYF